MTASIATGSPRGRRRAAAALVLACAALPALAQPPRQPEPPPLAAADRQAIVEDIAKALDDVYVFPETATKMGEHVRGQLRSGAYDELTSVREFADRLTEDLQSVSKDRHLRVFLAPPPPAGGGGPTPEQRERFQAQARRDNYCFREAKLLTGNVGYLKLDCFADASLAGPTAVAAMQFLSGSDAIVFDLRDNGGGAPSMIQLLTTYLLAEDDTTHLNSFYVRREDRTDQFWTHSWVPGRRLPDVPVYVLTSGRTFSAAEEFTYNLKNLKRGTIVGETTGGGAHPVDTHFVAGYPLAMALPFGRAINPISKTNWEGTGVAPDVAVPAADALAAAHEHALGAIAAKATDPETRAGVELARRIVAGRRQPVTLAAGELAPYVGTYGPRRVAVEGGALVYQRGQNPKLRLTPIGEDWFLVGDLGDFAIRFERDAAGRVVRLVGVDPRGEEPSERSGG